MSQSVGRPLRIGIVGAGHMGSVHARHWASVPDAHIVGFADARSGKAARLAEAYNTKVFGSVEQLLDAGIDAVSVCVPTDGHVEVVLTTLTAGVATLCEKPMALTLAGCDAIIAERDATSTLLTIGHVVRFFPEFANAKRLVDAGSVGTPAAVRVRRGGAFPYSDTDWFADPARSGGVIGDLMVHDIDWLQWCFGPIKRVYARSLTSRLSENRLDHLDYALLTMRHENGVISHAEGTWSDPGGFATSFEIAGDGGLLSHDSRKSAPLVKSLRGPGPERDKVQLPSSPLADSDDPYLKQILAFATSVREGTPVAVTAEDARRTIAVALAAQESARTGHAVEMGQGGAHA